MKRKPQQQSLIPEPQDLVWEVLEKVRSAGILDLAEMRLLEQAAAGELAKAKAPRGWQGVVNTWFAEYEKAIGTKCPKPTDNEFKMLRAAAKRVGIERVCKLISGFWRWRQSNEYFKNVQPNPCGLVKHLASVDEFVAEEEKTLRSAQRTLEQRRKFEAEARAARRPERRQKVDLPASGPNAAAIKKFTQELAGMKSVEGQREPTRKEG